MSNGGDKPHEKEGARVDKMRDNRLELLFQYTKFHIGIYITLGSILLAALIEKDKLVHPNYAWAFIPALFLLALAGFAGGHIAGNIPQFSKFQDFENEELPVVIRWPKKKSEEEEKERKKKKGWTYEKWAWLEHRVFWLAVLWLAIGPLIVHFCCSGAVQK